MEARHRGLRSTLGGNSSPIVPPNLMVNVDLESVDGDHYSLPTLSKERKSSSSSRFSWCGIGVCITLLLLGLVYVVTQTGLLGSTLSGSVSTSRLAPKIGSTYGTVRKPTGFPSTAKTQSRLEAEHTAKQEKLTKNKLLGKDALRKSDKAATSSNSGPSGAAAHVVPPPSQAAVDSTQSANLATLVQLQVEKVRRMKFEHGVVMEKDPLAVQEIGLLQSLLREFIPERYGPEPYFVEMKLHFPDCMAEPNLDSDGIVLLQLAPLELMPYAVFYFLQVVESFRGGAFHRVAGHVLQAMVTTPVSSLAFQEYNPQYPHVRYSLGFAGAQPLLLSPSHSPKLSLTFSCSHAPPRSAGRAGVLCVHCGQHLQPWAGFAGIDNRSRHLLCAHC